MSEQTSSASPRTDPIWGEWWRIAQKWPEDGQCVLVRRSMEVFTATASVKADDVLMWKVHTLNGYAEPAYMLRTDEWSPLQLEPVRAGDVDARD
jgi:hypothetical protein